MRLFHRHHIQDENDVTPAKSRRWHLRIIRPHKFIGYFRGASGCRYIALLPMLVFVLEPKPPRPLPVVPEGAMRGEDD